MKTQHLCDAAKAVLREFHSETGLPSKTRKISFLKYQLKQLAKEKQTNKTQSQRKGRK